MGYIWQEVCESRKQGNIAYTEVQDSAERVGTSQPDKVDLTRYSDGDFVEKERCSDSAKDTISQRSA